MSKLLQEVVTQLSYLFKAEPRFVRKRVEQLIDKEYLERDKANPTFLLYVA